jgi:hypothetical protein
MLNVATVPTTHLLWIPLCPILICSLLIAFLLSICVAIRDGVIRLKRLHQVPCSHCAFFTGDYRLKCTVHPCKALSEEAIGCLDYEPMVTSPRTSCVNSRHFRAKSSARCPSKSNFPGELRFKQLP